MAEKILESGNIFEIQRMIDDAKLDGWILAGMGCSKITTPNSYFCALMVRDGE